LQQSTENVVSVRVHLSRALLLLSLLLTSGASPAWSEDAPRLEKLTVALWPEYDRPAVLVTYRVQLATDVVLPAQIALPVPTHVGMPHAIARRGPDGNLYTATSTREVEGDWATITVMTDSPSIQLEYYAPILSTGDDRKFIYRWPGGLEIAQFEYEVLQPKYATNLAVMPSPTDEYMTTFGVLVQHAELGALSGTEDTTVAFTYSNPGERLTVTQASAPKLPSTLLALPTAAEPEQPTPPSTEPTSGISSTQITLIVLGITAAFIAGLWMGRNKDSDLPD
jgi:hypothetical protein